MAGPVRRFLRELWRFDRNKVNGRPALRCAVGVALPLVVGTAAGFPGDGVAAAIGSLSSAFASFQGVYRTRAAAVAITGTGMAASTFIAATVARHDWLVVPLTGGWGFAAGLLVALGPAATVVGLQCAVAFIVVSDYPMSAGAAATRAALVLAGSFVQLLLVVSFWPLRTYRAERNALAAGYRSLAGYSAAVAGEKVVVPDPDSLQGVAKTLADANPLVGDRVEADFRSLLDEAERIRVELAALAHVHQTEISSEGPDSVAPIDEALQASSVALRDVAAFIDQAPLRRARPPVASGARLLPAPAPDRVAPATRAALDALDAELRAALRIAASIGEDDEEPVAAVTVVEPVRRAVLPVRGSLLTLRANLNLRSEACRHAIRLGLVLGLTSVLYRVVPVQRGYWVALTALVVLKPDFSATVVRGIGRIVGTAIGAVVATVVAAEVRPDTYLLVAMVAILAFAAIAVFLANYPLFTVFLTGYVVFLLALIGLPSHDAAVARLLDTAVGGAIALVAYVAWPTWEGVRTAEKLSTLLIAQGKYGAAVLRAYGDSPDDHAALRSLLVSARLARSNAQASVDRLLNEPGKDRFSPDIAIGVVAAVRRFARAALTLHAYIPILDKCVMDPVESFAQEVDSRMQGLADVVGGRRNAVALPRLGPSFRGFRDAVAGHNVASAVLISAGEVMADAVDTMSELVERQSG